MSRLTAADISQIPVRERVQLVADIWNSIVEAPDSLELTGEDKRVIDERLDSHRRNPVPGSSWEDVSARIRSRKK